MISKKVHDLELENVSLKGTLQCKKEKIKRLVQRIKYLKADRDFYRDAVEQMTEPMSKSNKG